MSSDLLILLATALMALVTTVAAVVTTRAARRVAAASRTTPEPVEQPAAEPEGSEAPVLTLVPLLREAPVHHVVDGRVVVVPTPEQLVATTLSRPTTRLDVLLHGAAHALRPESRDRILAMMRRELRRRRRERSRAARRAARATVPAPPAAPGWLGEQQRGTGS